MSPTPPISSASSSRAGRAAAASSDAAAGDGVTLNVEQARGAQRNGVIWILAISLSLAVVVLGAFLLIQAPKMQAVNHPSGRDLNAQDVRKMYPQPSTLPAPTAGTNSTGGA